jgi:enterochelin esterase family protein
MADPQAQAPVPAYPAPPGARPSRLQAEAIHSPALEGNHLGDPATRLTPVCLPPEYDAQPERRFPVVYWLHGFTGTAYSGLSWRPWEPSVPEVWDRAQAQTGTPAILVLVDGFTRYGGSQYVNSSFNGNYEDYVQDVVRYVDSHFRTLAAPEGRAVAGKSSGGYGALVLGMRHPDVFGALASVSGDCFFELCYKPDFPKVLAQIARHGSVQAFLDAFLAAPKKSGDAVGAMSSGFAMAMAYSPNPSSEVGFDLPFDTYTGELLPDVWTRWEAADPVHLAAQHAGSLRRLKLVYFEAGLRDEFNLQYGARVLHRRLEALGVPHEHAEFDDGHGGINYRYDVTFARLLRALAP